MFPVETDPEKPTLYLASGMKFIFAAAQGFCIAMGGMRPIFCGPGLIGLKFVKVVGVC